MPTGAGFHRGGIPHGPASTCARFYMGVVLQDGVPHGRSSTWGGSTSLLDECALHCALLNAIKIPAPDGTRTRILFFPGKTLAHYVCQRSLIERETASASVSPEAREPVMELMTLRSTSLQKLQTDFRRLMSPAAVFFSSTEHHTLRHEWN